MTTITTAIRPAGLHPLEGTQAWYDARLDDDVETMRKGAEQRAQVKPVFIVIDGKTYQDMTEVPLDYKIVGKTAWLDKLNNLDITIQKKALMPMASAMRTAPPSDSIITLDNVYAMTHLQPFDSGDSWTPIDWNPWHWVKNIFSMLGHA